MANLKQLRQRIKSSKNTFQITRAMKLVSAAKFRRAQEKALHVSTYFEEIQNLINIVRKSDPNYEHPLIEKRTSTRSEQRCVVILITADRGLAGSFNNAILKAIQKFIQTNHFSQIEFICIGKKGFQFCQRQNYKVITCIPNQQKDFNFQTFHEIGTMVQDMYLNREINTSFICYSKFYSAIKQEPTINKFLPIEIPENCSADHPQQILFEPNSKDILDHIINQYIGTYLYQTVTESIASEHGAGMSAMTNATENATKMINKLTIINNRERQARITKEISEIVGGAKVLNV